jgi:hypothetical protein
MLAFLFEEIHIQQDSGQGIADLMRDACSQAAQQGKVGGPLRFPFQTLALSHLVAQSSSTLLDTLFEFSVRLPKRRLALLQEDSRVVQSGTDLLHFLHRTRGIDGHG